MRFPGAALIAAGVLGVFGASCDETCLEECPAGQYCGGSECVACQVADPCLTEGAGRCTDTTNLQTCTRDSTGCLAWSAPASCGSGQSCFGGTINQCVADACGGVPAGGACANAQTVSICGMPTGQGTRQAFTYPCPAGTQCQVGPRIAECVPTGACVPGTSSCLDATRLQTCNAGTQATTTCEFSCLTTALGAMCTSAVPLTLRTASLTYTVRPAATDYSGWSSGTFDAVIPDLLVLSYRGDSLLDASTTDASGGFQIRIPTTPDPTDRVVFVAAAADPAGGLAFVVGDPGFTTSGTRDLGALGTDPRAWSWSIASGDIVEADTLVISEAAGSGALRVFDYARYAYQSSRDVAGRNGLSLVIWLGYGTDWSCGACFAQLPTVFLGGIFQTQLWMPGGLSDERWWSDAVTAHELGHWAMSSYGTSPGEGGRHVVGAPSMPGLAWSEGWATWHSAQARSSSVYYDKQQGSMFWLDLETSSYSGGTPWQLPIPSGGLLQTMDENHVASILWTIGGQAGVSMGTFFQALGGARMNTSPWARGYTLHFWSELNAQSLPLNPVDTGISKPALPDFLDALICNGVAASAVNAATVPATQYPYPSSQPLCQ